MKLLDRAYERATIEEVIGSADHGTIRVFQIDGPFGVGKSDLLRFAAGLAASHNIAFRFEDDIPIHKCRQGDHERDFSLLTPMIGALSLRHPKAFARTTAESIRSLPIQPLSQMALHVAENVPYLKGAAKAYEVETSEFARSKTRLLSLARDSHIVQALSEFIANTLAEEAPAKRVVFALDDIEWADLFSFRTMLSAARRLARQSFDVLIVCTSCSSGDDRQNLNEIESVIHDFSEASIQRASIDNLSREQTREVVAEFGRCLDSELVDYVYALTSGNFAELVHLLRQRDDKLRLLYENWRAENAKPSDISRQELWHRHLTSLLSASPQLRHILSVLVAMNNVVLVEELRYLYPIIADIAGGRPLSRAELEVMVSPARTSGDIQLVGDYVIAAKRTLDSARVQFLRDGSFTANARRIAAAYRGGRLGTIVDWPDGVSKSVAILAGVDPGLALETFTAALPRLREIKLAPTPLLLGAASAFGSVIAGDVDGSTIELGAELVCLLCEQSTFDAGAEVGQHVYVRRQWLEPQALHRFLLAFLTCLREAGQLSDDSTEVGRDIVNELLEIAEVPEHKAAILVLATTVYEHLTDYDSIRAAYDTLDQVIPEITDEPARRRCEIAYARNLGLNRFHGDIIVEYEAAMKLVASSTGTSFEVASDIASLLNHIGLGHYHSGRVRDAMEFFRRCMTELDHIGRRFETPLNNLGASLFVLGREDEALEYFDRARDIAIKPRYQALSIDINFSLCLFKLGHEDMAISTLRAIADGDRPAPDPAIVSHAQANLAYCLMRQESYAAAADYYSRSNSHRFRFLTQERAAVRQLMARYCAARAGILSGEDLGDMSFMDLDETSSDPSRRAYQLDLNSLYIV